MVTGLRKAGPGAGLLRCGPFDFWLRRTQPRSNPFLRPKLARASFVEELALLEVDGLLEDDQDQEEAEGREGRCEVRALGGAMGGEKRGSIRAPARASGRLGRVGAPRKGGAASEHGRHGLTRAARAARADTG